MNRDLHPSTQPKIRRLNRLRNVLQLRVERLLEKPMIVLGFVWLTLLIVEFTRGLSVPLQRLNFAIWIIFVVEFLFRFTIAPSKLPFLRSNWLTIIALIVPALRVFRIFRAIRFLRFARASRSLRLIRVITSINRGMSSLRLTLRRNRFGYVMALTAVITFAGAAGMYAFERSDSGEGPFNSYSYALWWTSMMMTTMGSDFWPRSAEGRTLCLLLSIYAFAIWGYVTATIATFFLGTRKGVDSAPGDVTAINELRRQLRTLESRIEKDKSRGRKETSPTAETGP